jgi:hypothetical protein
MRWVRSFLPLAAPLTLMAGCGVQGEPTATLSEIVPASAYNDTPVSIQLYGGPFRPSVEVDTYSGTAEVAGAPFQVFLDPSPLIPGRRSIMAAEPTWKDRGRVDATIPAGLPAGEYTVGMRDPRGNLVPPPIMFRSLGPDLDAPRITFLQPAADTPVSAGETVTVVARIDDGQGHVLRAGWSVSSPSLAPVPRECHVGPDLLCSFSFTVPTGSAVLEVIEVRVDAEDTLHNQSTGYLLIPVAWAPVISNVTPPTGPTGGGTEIVVEGSNFVVGLSQVLVDGVVIGGVVDGGSITAVTQGHQPGIGLVAVSNGHSRSNPLGFNFVARPNVRLVSPTHAPADPPPKLEIAGNDFSEVTQFYWLDADRWRQFLPSPDPDASPPAEIFINSSRVQLNLMPGSGTVTILAHDDVAGDSEVPDAFTFDPAP